MYHTGCSPFFFSDLNLATEDTVDRFQVNYSRVEFITATSGKKKTDTVQHDLLANYAVQLVNKQSDDLSS